MTVLSDPHHTRSDARMVRRAVLNGWPVADKDRPVIVDRLVGIVAKTSVTALDATGKPVELDDAADKNAIAAARVLVAMTGENLSDAHHADKIEVDRLNAATGAVNAGVHKTYLGLDPGRV